MPRTTDDAWRRRFPTRELLDVVDVFADLVAARVAERTGSDMPSATAGERGALSPADAAAYLSVSETTVRKLIADGTIRSLHLGARVVVPKAALDELLAGERVAS